MTIEPRIEEPTDQFPVGMRVLAVDDDPTCLLLLERLLRKCKYHVTTRTHAIAALNLLRENKNRFDLVISDVHMPDMDGFKLLELVGLEMDLPVIMLSANGDPKLVMKGITHGACDYLLKPVRIEELQIIWQHVVRKKKVDPKDKKGSFEGRAGNGQSDQKSNKKRKDQVDYEDDDDDEIRLENDDPSAQKKPRVVWSIELHRKFVAAVNHLGLDKAVPKRILELMNVEKLTRENVASHLQKYRLYLRRISVQNQQASMAAALTNTDPASYTRISSFNSMGGFNQLSRPQFQNDAFRSFLPNTLLSRLNSPANLGIQQLPSATQVNHSHFPGFTDQSATLLPGNPSGCILKGMPISFKFDQLQHNVNTGVNHIGELPNKVDDLTVFPVSGGLPNAKPTIGNLNVSHYASLDNTLMLQEHPVQPHSRIGIGNQSSDRARGIDHWPVVAVQSSALHSNSFSSYSGGQLISTNLDKGSSINELPLSVTDYQYERAHFIPDSNSTDLCDALTTPEQITNPRTQDGILSELNAVENPSYVSYSSMQNSLVDSMPMKQEYEIGNRKPQAYQLPNTVGSLEDLVSSLMK